jgi:hypothetical protein
MNMSARDMLTEMTSPEKSRNSQLVKKWSKLLEGITRPDVRVNMAKLYENQMGHLRQLTEETRTTNVGEFLKYIFPVLRRVWPSLIANEIVSVQPMTGPIGGIFYYELKYGTDKGSISAGQNLIETFQHNYSDELIDKEVFGLGNTSATVFSGTLDFTPIKDTSFDCNAAGNCSGNVVGGSVKVYVGETGVSGIDDGQGNITGTGVSGTIDYSTGAIAVSLGSAPASGVEIYASYTYNSESNTTIPEVYLDIELCEIKAKTRKLKALWSSEAADDLKAFHGLDAEAELVAGLASEIALEIDREIIQDIRSGALASNYATFDADVPTGMTQVDHYRTLITVITKLSNRIHKLGIRGPANWIVTSPEVSTIVEQLGTHGDFRPIFAPSNAERGAPAEEPQNFGIYKAGTLQNKWTVYKDVKFQADEMLVGYKGQNFVDAGYVFAPYIPLQATSTFLDPNNFQFRKALRTRYAKKLCRPELFARIKVSNLP